MPIQLFQIFLDKDQEPYASGEELKGKFVVVVADSYSHKGIYLKFEGHAIIKWNEESSCFEHTVAKQHRARKQFFDASFKFASEETLSEGTHIFPFEYSLPQKLPSSLATPTITIWYKLEIVISKSTESGVKVKPRREVILFNVKGRLDLNDINEDEGLELTSPVSEVVSRSQLGLSPPCFCSLNYVSLGLKLERKGFVPGDKLVVQLALITDTQFTFVSLSLLQEISVTTKEKMMIERRTLVKLSLPDLLPSDDDEYRRWDEVLMIPPEVPVTYERNDVPDIKISYFIRFSAEATSFPYKIVKLRLPFVVGTFPLAVASPVREDDDVVEEKTPLPLLDDLRKAAEDDKDKSPPLIVVEPHADDENDERDVQVDEEQSIFHLSPVTKKGSGKAKGRRTGSSSVSDSATSSPAVTVAFAHAEKDRDKSVDGSAPSDDIFGDNTSPYSTSV